MDPKKAGFRAALLQWHRTENFREMPWKGEKEPYRIWLSEVILQQTRVEQGWSYYQKFITAFPTVRELASAPEEKVMKLWEGLGYYSRCRNLISTAKKIDAEYHGEFPATYRGIIELKGIGPYTAAAIASFAYGLPHAVVDGNVTRILARFFGIGTPIDSSGGKKEFARLAAELLDPDQAAVYNQAIMDFGATVCTPRNPLCDACVQRAGCTALSSGLVDQLPRKEKRLRKKQRYFYYFVVETPDDQVYIRKRSGKDIWEGLHEFLLCETGAPAWPEELVRSPFIRDRFGDEALTVRHISNPVRQELTHQSLQGQFITIRLGTSSHRLPDHFLVPRSRLADYAFPKLINGWLAGETSAQSLF